MIGRTNVGGGFGGTGATLVVSAPSGVTVTATKDDKTYTRVVNNDGTATFKGLSSGTWALSMSDASHDPTTPVDVVITADYYVTLAFFSATINVKFPTGSTCKAVHTDGTELTAPDTSGTWSCIVPSAGTWTVKCYDGADYDSSEKKKSESVEITSDGETKAITLAYALLLYSLGNECSETTGGWKTVSGSVNKLTDHIHINGNGSTGGRMRTANLLNLATLRQNYSKIYMDIVVPVADGRIRLGFTTKTDFSSNASDYICSLNPTQATSRTVFSIDIASSDVSAYFAVVSWAYETSPNIDVYRIWLE